MKSNANRARPMRPAFIGLVVFSILAAVLLAACGGDPRGGLEKLNIPYSEARFIEEAGKGNAEVVQLFVEAGMKVTGANSPGQKAFAAAVRGKRRGVLAYLRQAGVTPLAETALRKNNVPYTVEEFLRRIGAGDAETVKLFLAAGMNPNAQSVDGRTALGLAEKNQPDNMVAVLYAAGAKLNPLEGLKKLGLKFDHDAFLTVVKKGDLAAVKLFVEAGMVLDTQDRPGLTALAWAVHGNHFEMVKYLLSKNADPNVVMNIPGGRIRERGSSTSIRVYGAHINVALLEAAYHGNEKLARLLVENKAVARWAVYFIAAHRGHLGVIKAILLPGLFKSRGPYYLYRFALGTNKKRIVEELDKLGAGEFPKGKYPRSLVVGFQWVFQNLSQKFGRTHPEYARLLGVLIRTKF